MHDMNACDRGSVLNRKSRDNLSSSPTRGVATDAGILIALLFRDLKTAISKNLCYTVALDTISCIPEVPPFV